MISASMSRSLFDKELHNIRATIQTLGQRAQEATARAVQAYINSDYDAAAGVKQKGNGDHIAHRMNRKVHREQGAQAPERPPERDR